MAKNTKFNKLLERLEQIVEKLEREDLDLDEAAKYLEEGLKIHKMCRNKLRENQDKVEKIISLKEVN